MKNEIVLREFQKEDTEAVASIISEAWHYTDLCSPKTARKLAMVFLNSCLTNQTYTQAAILNQVPVGIIMAKNEKAHSCPIKYRIRQILSILSLYASGEGRKVSKIFSSVSTIDRQLLSECKSPYQGELSFFAVSAASRGKGVGKMLFQSMTDYMKSQNISDYFLFTDTSCNYGFYEHQGLQRRCEKSTSFTIDDRKRKMTFFLYDNRGAAKESASV